MNLVGLALALLFTPVGDRAQDEVTVYKAGKIITVSGETVSPGVLVISAGKIVEIGSEVPIPEKATVVDLSEYTLFPGLVH